MDGCKRRDKSNSEDTIVFRDYRETRKQKHKQQQSQQQQHGPFNCKVASNTVAGPGTHETAETSAIAGTISTPGALAKAGTPEMQGPLWTPTVEKTSASGESTSAMRYLQQQGWKQQGWNRGGKKQKCAADFSLLNLPKGKSLGRSKPATNS
jgi:hypothetical protein